MSSDSSSTDTNNVEASAPHSSSKHKKASAHKGDSPELAAQKQPKSNSALDLLRGRCGLLDILQSHV